jgi:myo-inositol-1(or 4)-monophosphatase
MRLRELLGSLDSEAGVVGEETGGDLPNTGLAVAIDPIDGTWAFLTETETYSTTLALVRDRRAVLGMVSNPVTGEIAYATEEGDARIVRLPVFGEEPTGHDLPTRRIGEGPTLVNLHPARSARSVVAALYEAWGDGAIDMVRSAGGSPAWAMVEAARGHFVYVNLWSKRGADAWDLAAGALVVRKAGGEVVDTDGQPIDALRHAGPFIAGLEGPRLSRVAELVQDGVS